jgi:hypothetical protein
MRKNFFSTKKRTTGGCSMKITIKELMKGLKKDICKLETIKKAAEFMIDEKTYDLQRYHLFLEEQKHAKKDTHSG